MRTCKLYARNKMYNTKIGKLIQLMEESVIVDCRLGQYDYNERISTNSKIQVEEVNESFRKRDLRLCN